MDINLAEKIEGLEARLPRWEKWLYACLGAAVTMLGNSIARAFERAYLTDAFFRSLKNVNPAAFTENASFAVTDPISLAIQQALFVPYWQILGYFLLSVILIPVVWLAFHPLWRQVPLAKRGDLIFGFLLAGWVTVLSLGALDLLNVDDAYNTLVVVYLLALGLGYWRLRRKKNKAEEVFP